MSRTNGGLMVTETNQAYFAKVADCLVQEALSIYGRQSFGFSFSKPDCLPCPFKPFSSLSFLPSLFL